MEFLATSKCWECENRQKDREPKTGRVMKKERHEFIRKRERNGDNKEIYKYMHIERFVSMSYINIEFSPIIMNTR